MVEKCAICRKPDLRKLIELGWNAKMSAPDIASAFGGMPSSGVILKHLHDHADEGAAIRAIPVEDQRTMRERVSALQKTLVEEVERRITLAQEWAAYAKAHGNPEADWHDQYNVLDKDNQAAIASIIKMQGLTDKREIGKAKVGVDLAKLMLGGDDGLAPKRLTAGKDNEEPVEGEVVEVPDGGSAE